MQAENKTYALSSNWSEMAIGCLPIFLDVFDDAECKALLDVQ